MYDLTQKPNLIRWGLCVKWWGFCVKSGEYGVEVEECNLNLTTKLGESSLRFQALGYHMVFHRVLLLTYTQKPQEKPGGTGGYANTHRLLCAEISYIFIYLYVCTRASKHKLVRSDRPECAPAPQGFRWGFSQIKRLNLLLTKIASCIMLYVGSLKRRRK